MSHTFNDGPRSLSPTREEKRFSRLAGGNATATQLLQGCPVVTAEGSVLGTVRLILMDRMTRRLRYVVLKADEASASVALPWHALYFDSALARLVFYTYS